MSKILITGADGFLGKEVVKKIVGKNWDFFGISKTKSDNYFLQCDLSIPEDVLILLKKLKPEIVINLAAKANFNTKESKDLYPVNTLLPGLLSQYCASEKKFLIQASGIIVHGLSHQKYNAKAVIQPDSAYGKSKLLADCQIIMSECSSVVLRYGGLFGNNGPSHLGINKAILNAQKGILPKVVGKGAAKRNYIYVKDAAKVIIKCIENNIMGIHYIGGEVKTIMEMALDICDRFIPDQKPEMVEGKDAQDQVIESNSIFEITSFRTALNQIP